MSKQVLREFIDDLHPTSKSKESIKKEKKQMNETKAFKSKKEAVEVVDKDRVLDIYRAMKQCRGTRREVSIENVKKRFFKCSATKRDKLSRKNNHDDNQPQSVFTDADFNNLFN